MRRLSTLLAFGLAAVLAAVLTVEAQYGHGSDSGDSREACRRAARALVDQEARWDDSRSGLKSAANVLYWKAVDGTYGLCRVDGRGRVYEVRVERWGHGQDDISVWPGSGAGESSRLLRCESDRGRRRECSTPRGAHVRLFDRLSDSPCVEGRTWGHRRDHIWVDDGCRAIFEVRW